MKTSEQWKRDSEEYGPKLKALLTKHKMFGHLDPGGAEVKHPVHGKMRLSAYDDKDDYDAVVQFLQEHGIEVETKPPKATREGIMAIYRECFQHLGQLERKRVVTAPNTRLRLNRGERPQPLLPSIQGTIANALMARLGEIQQYPSYPEFYQKLSKFLGVPADQIVVGAGIEEFIRTLMFLCCGPGDRAAVLWPTCAMYDIYAQAFGVDLLRVPTKPGTQLSVGQLASWTLAPSNPPVRVLFVPNPGQPVGTYYSPNELAQLAYVLAKKDILLVVDEAHHGFGAATAMGLINEHNNVLVLRTFSKFFGAASIRVGYAVGHSRVIKPLNAVRPSGEIAGPSMVIASALLDKYDELVDGATATALARDWLVGRIRDLGLRAFGHVGFSVLVEFPSPVACLKVGEGLATQGVYVKMGFPSPIASCMLLACGRREVMEAFYGEFEQCWREVCVGTA